MNQALELEMEVSPATDGDIAVINLQSTREGAWSRFWRTPDRPGLAEFIIEQEGFALAFLGDCDALDRMALLAEQLVRMDDGAIRTVLIQAQVASATHRFADARRYLVQARLLGAPAATVDRLSLGIDQACGTHPEPCWQPGVGSPPKHGIWRIWCRSAHSSPTCGNSTKPTRSIAERLRDYQDVSPFALAWVCFQLGVLWGELVPERQSARAARWYRKAVEYLPSYVKARVHLAEI